MLRKWVGEGVSSPFRSSLFLMMPLVGYLMFRVTKLEHRREIPHSLEGPSFSEALGSRTFWVLATCFGLITVGVGGLSLHFLVLLADAHVAPATAGKIASLSGVMQIVARLATGWLVDRIFAPYVATVVMACSAICLLIMAFYSFHAAIFGALAIGLATGAEVDLIGYLTSRYFGMRAFGRIYGLLYGLYLIGAGLSAALYGSIYDATGSYTPTLYFAALTVLFSGLLFLALPRFQSVSVKKGL
jgi:cyanate permease